MHGRVASRFVSGPHRERDLGLLLFALAALLPSIWSEGSISGQDEYYLSFRTVLEMRERGEWLVPWVNGEVRLQKPPLLYWAMLVAMELLGPNAFAARMPSVAAGALFAVAAARLARRCGASAMLTGLLVVAAAGVAVEARRAMFDLPVACLATWSLVLGMDWWRRGSVLALQGAAVLLAAAAMTKGPVALWFVAAPALAGLVVHRRRPVGPWWQLLPALALFAALALPWPLYVAKAHPEFFAVMSTQAENRAFGLSSLTGLPGLVGALIGLCAPWSLLLLSAAWASARGRTDALRTGRWLLTWVAIGLVPFALMRSFERYVLAFVAPLAVLTAMHVERLSPRALLWHLRGAMALLTVPMVGFGALVVGLGLAVVPALLGAAVLVVGWRCLRREAHEPAMAFAGLGLVTATLLGVVYPAIGVNRLPESLPSAVGSARVATFGRPQPGMLSLRIGRSAEHMAKEPDGLPERLRGFHGHLFVHDDDLPLVQQTATTAGLAPRTLVRFGSFYSRKAWLRFYRDGATASDWWQAVVERDPTRLQPHFTCLEFP